MDKLVDLIFDIDENGEDLTRWEIDFISDLVDRDVRQFTKKEGRKIRQIYRERVH